MKYPTLARSFLFVLAAISGANAASVHNPYNFTLMAGSPFGVSGNRPGFGPAARFTFPAGVSVNAFGNVFVVEMGNAAAIRKISQHRNVTSTTLRGESLGSASGIIVDSAGDCYVADSNRHRILKIDASGNVSVFAGSGSVGQREGKGTAATFSSPAALTRDRAGNLYVADAGSGWIRKISPRGAVENWVGGFNGPRGLCIDSGGNIYVADELNHAIKKITPLKVVTTVAGTSGGWEDGNASDARLRNPRGVAVDKFGRLFVTDTGNHVIRMIAEVGGVTTVTTIAGIPETAGKPNDANGKAFDSPHGIAVDSGGNIYVADYGNHVIWWCVADPPVRPPEPFAVAWTGQIYTDNLEDGLPADLVYSGPTATIPGLPTIPTLTPRHAVPDPSNCGALVAAAVLGMAVFKRLRRRHADEF